MPSQDWEVIVAGGGPAGSTAAALLAEAGHRVLLLERERFPRFHIGESLMPETYWTLCRLGVLEKMKASAFPKKYSVQFIGPEGQESQPFYFFQRNPHESSQTWQVWRAEFDSMLLENAREKGVEIRTGARVLDLIWDGEQAIGVRAQSDGDRAVEIRSSVVVDATGQSALVANRLGIRQPDPYLRKASVWTYYQGAQRDPGIDEGATLVLHTEGKKGWFWYIPLPDDTVSVGVVSSLAYLMGERRSPEEIFFREVERCPGVAARLSPGQRTAPFYVTKDFSYRAARWAGPGWVLVGDAFGFLDPIYSTGVFLALKSGEWAADAIHEALCRQDFSAEQLGSWGPRFSEGMDLLRRLVYAFYTPEFHFGQFIRQHPEYRDHLIDLLMGNVFQEGVEKIFTAMGDVTPPHDEPTAETPPFSDPVRQGSG